MPTTCASCRAEVGDAAFCPQCGQAVLSPQSAGQSAPPPTRGDWRTRHGRTRSRPGVPSNPPRPTTTPGPVRFPLYADELDVHGHTHGPTEDTGYQDRPSPPPAYLVRRR